MSSHSDDDDHTRTRMRRQIIEAAVTNQYRARAEAQRERLLQGEVSDERIASFQQAVLDLYWALRPLREADPVADWWDDVVLSKHWTEEQATVEGDLTGRGVSVSRDVVPKTGLDTLETVERMSTTTTESVDTFIGERVQAVPDQQFLPYEVLADVSGVLEDAAGKLGFNPTTPTPDQTDPDPV